MSVSTEIQRIRKEEESAREGLHRTEKHTGKNRDLESNHSKNTL